MEGCFSELLLYSSSWAALATRRSTAFTSIRVTSALRSVRCHFSHLHVSFFFLCTESDPIAPIPSTFNKTCSEAAHLSYWSFLKGFMENILSKRGKKGLVVLTIFGHVKRRSWSCGAVFFSAWPFLTKRKKLSLILSTNRLSTIFVCLGLS